MLMLGPIYLYNGGNHIFSFLTGFSPHYSWTTAWNFTHKAFQIDSTSGTKTSICLKKWWGKAVDQNKHLQFWCFPFPFSTFFSNLLFFLCVCGGGCQYTHISNPLYMLCGVHKNRLDKMVLLFVQNV